MLQYHEGHIDRVTGLRFSPAGDRLYSAAHDGWVRIWGADGQLIAGFRVGEALGIRLSPEGQRLVTIQFDGPALAWDVASGKKIGEYTGSISGDYDGAYADFTRDGRFMALSLGAGGPISLWQLTYGKKLWEGGMMAMAFSPDNRRFAHAELKGDASGEIVLQTADGQHVIDRFNGHNTMIWRLVFSPDGQLLASCDGGVTRIWMVDNGEIAHTWGPSCAP